MPDPSGQPMVMGPEPPADVEAAPPAPPTPDNTVCKGCVGHIRHCHPTAHNRIPGICNAFGTIAIDYPLFPP